MQANKQPSKIQLPFANSGNKNTIPVASQIGIKDGAASFTDGFPPLTMTPIASGGVPPYGQDFNGVLNQITAIQQWQSAGGGFTYDSAFATAIGGYPAGAILVMADNSGYWLCLADNNTTNPDATDGTAANWAPLAAYGIAAVTGLANANVTLTPNQFGKPIITFAGTLTGNVQITLPTIKAQWLVVNNTTGAFSLTVKTAAGSGVVLTQGQPVEVYCDGTNIVQTGFTQAQGDARYVQIANATNVPAGTIIEYSGTTAPSGYLVCPTAQTNISRATYANLFNAITVQTAGNTTNGSTSVTAVGSTAGMAVGYPISGPGIPAGTTISAIGSGTLTLSAAATATATGVTLVVAPWGAGDGSTTFGMPWFPADYVGVQANGNIGTSTAGQVIAHTHTYGLATYGGSNGNLTGNNPNNSGWNTTNTGSTGGSANLAAGMRVLRCVKY